MPREAHEQPQGWVCPSGWVAWCVHSNAFGRVCPSGWHRASRCFWLSLSIWLAQGMVLLLAESVRLAGTGHCAEPAAHRARRWRAVAVHGRRSARYARCAGLRHRPRLLRGDQVDVRGAAGAPVRGSDGRTDRRKEGRRADRQIDERLRRLDAGNSRRVFCCWWTDRQTDGCADWMQAHPTGFCCWWTYRLVKLYCRSALAGIQLLTVGHVGWPAVCLSVCLSSMVGHVGWPDVFLWLRDVVGRCS
jgi:hypothetical protein